MALLDSRRDKVKEDVNPILNICLKGSQQGPSPPERSKSISEEGSSHVRDVSILNQKKIWEEDVLSSTLWVASNRSTTSALNQKLLCAGSMKFRKCLIAASVKRMILLFMPLECLKMILQPGGMCYIEF